MSCYYGSECLHKIAFRIHFELLLNSKDSLAGRALLHMFSGSRPITWKDRAAKSSAYKRNVMPFAAAFRTCTILSAWFAKLTARRPALTTPAHHKDVPHTSPNPSAPRRQWKPSSNPPPPQPGSRNLRHGASHRCRSSKLISTSRVNRLLVRSAHEFDR